MSMKQVVFVLTIAVAVALAEDSYTDKYDNVNLDEILQNERLLENYFKCLINKGPCTAEGSELKKNIPDALQNECSKCNKNQKVGLEKVTKFLYNKKPEMWKELAKLYDPEGVYEKKYAERLKTLM